MADIPLEVWAERIAKGGRDELRRVLYREAGKVSQRAVGEAHKNLTTRRRVRSGRLYASVRSEVKSTRGGIDVHLMAGGTDGRGSIRYARIQEEGGTVRPRRAKFLTIPLDPAKYPSGVSRFKTARDAPNLTLAVSAAGQYMLVNKDTGEPWYLLRRRVKIKGKHYLRDAMRKAAGLMPPAVSEAFGDVLEVV